MQGVNGRRVLLAGLLAGLVMNILHVLSEGVLAGEMERMIQRLGLATPREGTLLVIVLGGFLLGILAVWLYAALRARYGPGPRTALRAGLTVWLLNCLFPNAALLAYGVLTPAFFWLASAADLVAVPLGTLAGAWAYRDRGEAPARTDGPVEAAAPR